MDALKLAQYCEEMFDLSKAGLADEYFYQSLPLCIIDAVFSIGVTYSSTQNVVKRYCDYFKLQRIRTEKDKLPIIDNQESVAEFINKIEAIGVQEFTTKIFCNKQRTSTQNGILKTEAVYRFAKELKQNGVNYLQEIPLIISSSEFENKIKKIPGQTSGISLKYFFMLSGASDLIKPDRMILRFLQNFFGQSTSLSEAQTLLQSASSILSKRYLAMNPRLLDYQIWNYQRTL